MKLYAQNFVQILDMFRVNTLVVNHRQFGRSVGHGRLGLPVKDKICYEEGRISDRT